MMKSSDFKIYVYDPHIDKNKSFLSKKINFLNKLNKINFFDAIFIGTPHKKIIKIGGKKILFTMLPNNKSLDENSEK